jgi:hypothetical protein
MTYFRRNLVVIFLVDLKLNDDNKKIQNLKDDEMKTYPADCMIVDRPLKNIFKCLGKKHSKKK